MYEIANEFPAPFTSGSGSQSASIDGIAQYKGTVATLQDLQEITPLPGMFAFVEDTQSTYVCYTIGTWTQQSGGGTGLIEHSYSFTEQTNFRITHNLGRIPLVRVYDTQLIDITDGVQIDHIDNNSFDVITDVVVSGVIKYY